MAGRYVWEAGRDGATARQIRAELGWIIPSVPGYLRFDHLLDEAERRYWQIRSEQGKQVEDVSA